MEDEVVVSRLPGTFAADTDKPCRAPRKARRESPNQMDSNGLRTPCNGRKNFLDAVHGRDYCRIRVRCEAHRGDAREPDRTSPRVPQAAARKPVDAERARNGNEPRGAPVRARRDRRVGSEALLPSSAAGAERSMRRSRRSRPRAGGPDPRGPDSAASPGADANGPPKARCPGSLYRPAHPAQGWAGHPFYHPRHAVTFRSAACISPLAERTARR
jgi:hypothetical protein